MQVSGSSHLKNLPPINITASTQSKNTNLTTMAKVKEEGETPTMTEIYIQKDS